MSVGNDTAVKHAAHYLSYSRQPGCHFVVVVIVVVVVVVVVGFFFLAVGHS